MIIALQIIGTASVITGLYLIAHKKRLAWLVYEIGGVAWILLYLKKGLHIAILAQLIYMGMNIYGYINWGKK